MTAGGSRLSLRQPANESTPETCCQRSSNCATYVCPLLPENTAVFQLTHVLSSCLFLPALKDDFLLRLQFRAAQQDLQLVTAGPRMAVPAPERDTVQDDAASHLTLCLSSYAVQRGAAGPAAGDSEYYGGAAGGISLTQHRSPTQMGHILARSALQFSAAQQDLQLVTAENMAVPLEEYTPDGSHQVLDAYGLTSGAGAGGPPPTIYLRIKPGAHPEETLPAWVTCCYEWHSVIVPLHPTAPAASRLPSDLLVKPGEPGLEGMSLGCNAHSPPATLAFSCCYAKLHVVGSSGNQTNLGC